MKTGCQKQICALSVLTVFIALLAAAPSAQALGFNSSDYSLSYLIVTGSPDVVKPGEAVSVNMMGKLAVASNASDIIHVRFFADTASKPSEVIMEGDLILPADATEGTRQFSVTIPSDVINNTWLYMSMSDDWRIFSKITISLVQNPTYFELKSQNSDLQSSNDTLSVLMYIAIFVAIVFIATTVYILSLTFKAKKSKRDNRTDSVLPKTVSVESP
jgi:hypothetical protein